MAKIIEIEELSKDYETGFWRKKKVRALDRLSLDVEAGRVFGFLGGNGAGKTTTIKILMGLLFPTSGKARILGSNISDVNMHTRIGYCPENPYFYDYLTAFELMDYFGSIFGIDRQARKRKTKELLTKVGLEERSWNKQLRKFSKGMLQRVGLAQALINEPEILFLDEPMSGLDPIGRREIRELIAGLRDAGTTVFMSTHILSDVESLCDEVAILSGGRLSAAGKLHDLLSRTAENRAYEINLSGVSPDDVSAIVRSLPSAVAKRKPGGVTIEVTSEKDIDHVLASARQEGGSLISVVPVRQSLEDLFVSETVSSEQWKIETGRPD